MRVSLGKANHNEEKQGKGGGGKYPDPSRNDMVGLFGSGMSLG